MLPQQLDQLHVGTLTAGSFTPPSGCIAAASVQANAAIEASKLQHRFYPDLRQAHGSAGTSERRVVHVVRGATGVLSDLVAGCVVAPIGAATHTIDVYKNGSSILTGTFQVDSADAAFAKVAGTFSNANVVVGDVLEIVVVAAAGGGTLGQGLFVQFKCDEAAN